MGRQKMKQNQSVQLGESSRWLKVLSGLATGVTAVACATPATPPESSPVYAEEMNPKVEPVDVEGINLGESEATKVEPTGSEQAKSDGEPKAQPVAEEASAEEAEDASAEDAAEEAPADDAEPPKAEPSKAEPAKTAPPAAPAKKKPAAKKPAAKKKAHKKAAGAEGGCGEGTCS